MQNDEMKNLDARRLKPDEHRALDSILRGHGSTSDETLIQAAIERERAHK
jgi:hypothetical protein